MRGNTNFVNSNSNEDEVLNTAHSQNIAASGNELRAEKAKNAAAKHLSTTKPNAIVPQQLPVGASGTGIASNQQSSGQLQPAALPPPRPFSKAPTIPPNIVKAPSAPSAPNVKAPSAPSGPSSTKKPKLNSNEDEDASYDYAYYDTSVNEPHEYAEIDFTDFGKTKTRTLKKH